MMPMQCKRQAQVGTGILGSDDDILAAFGEGTIVGSRRGVRAFGEVSHECDGCGGVTPDVDLWAEDSESGEELWLCVACGEW